MSAYDLQIHLCSFSNATFQEKHRQLIADQEEISKAIEAAKHFADQFRQRARSKGETQLEDEQQQGQHRDLLQVREAP